MLRKEEKSGCKLKKKRKGGKKFEEGNREGEREGGLLRKKGGTRRMKDERDRISRILDRSNLRENI